MKTILALQGKSCTGKTSTLSMLIDVFIDYGWKEINLYKTKTNKSDSVTDKTSVLKKGKSLIYLTTRGDTKEILESERQRFTDSGFSLNDCLLFICACRTSGGSVKFVSGSKHSYIIGKEYVKLPKCIKNKESIFIANNKKQAERLYQVITKIVLN